MTELTWGDGVKVRSDAPACYRPAATAAVVGMRAVASGEQAVRYDTPIGTYLYLIEYSDGSAIEIPERWLEYWKS